MTRNDKIAAVVVSFLITLILYYFLIPNRNWLGKPYLETAQNDGFAVVELFTSEGCSSCPPADKLLEKIQKESNGKKIYFLAFHVDYWDHLNWKDSFSSEQSTSRQQQYSSWMNRTLIYTPQFIVNGISEFGGDDARKLYSLVADALETKPAAALVLEAHANKEQLELNYETNIIEKNTSLFVALVQKQATTEVKRGENEGRLLHHVQIVRQAHTLSLEEKQGGLVLPMPENFNTTDWEIIGFLQDDTTGAINAATKATFN
mgnify:CR=1 FL=1